MKAQSIHARLASCCRQSDWAPAKSPEPDRYLPEATKISARRLYVDDQDVGAASGGTVGWGAASAGARVSALGAGVAGVAGAAPAATGGMFWLMWKKLSGSYFALSSVSRA